MNEIFIELLLKKLLMEDRVLSDSKCLDPLKHTQIFGPYLAARLVEDVLDALGEDNSKKLLMVSTNCLLTKIEM